MHICVFLAVLVAFLVGQANCDNLNYTTCIENDDCSTGCCENYYCAVVDNCELKDAIKTYENSQYCELGSHCSSLDSNKCCYFGKCKDRLECLMYVEGPALLFIVVGAMISVLLVKRATKTAAKLAEIEKEKYVNKLQEKIIERKRKELAEMRRKIKEQEAEEAKKPKEEIKEEGNTKVSNRYDDNQDDEYKTLDGYLLQNQKSSNIFEDPREPDFKVEFETKIAPREEFKSKESERPQLESDPEMKALQTPKKPFGDIISKQNEKYFKKMKDQLSVVDRSKLNF
ncbi:unnamed protein product [Moneuplotes crassus]|uniref:Uncharacterized protein n=1 Tax=Euplotes crassus TaxID=5936 RepID=A0AAD1XQ29_EUPCR|nr:unnamed protein product [Moneuplotes crassus]